MDYLHGEARVKERETNRKNYVRSQLKPEAQAKLRPLSERIEEIKRRLTQ
jgi:hypothetical protein